MGLGAYHGKDNNDRRREIVNWFLSDDRYPEDRLMLDVGYDLQTTAWRKEKGPKSTHFPVLGGSSISKHSGA